MKCKPKKTHNTITRAVVKVGSNVLTAKAGLNIDAIVSISSQICELMTQGIEIILVSSGAMASGMKKWDLPNGPTRFPNVRPLQPLARLV